MTAPAVPLSVGAGSIQGRWRGCGDTAGEVMAELMDQQDAEQGERKRPSR